MQVLSHCAPVVLYLAVLKKEQLLRHIFLLTSNARDISTVLFDPEEVGHDSKRIIQGHKPLSDLCIE